MTHRETKARVRLPAAYVAEWVELGYAATVHRVQGMTVDAGHVLVDESMTRNHLYTGATRGRYMNRLYTVTEAVLDVDLHHQPDGHAVFLFDSDTSGREATVRAWERLTPREAASAAGARLPGVKDPGELVEVGRAEELNRALRYPGPLTYDVIDHVVASNTHGDVTPALAVALARRLAGAVTRLPEDPDTRGYLAAVLSRHLAEETVREILAEARTPAPSMAEDASTADAPTRELAPRAPFVNGDVQVWLERQADLISDRLDALVADVEGPTPPLWARRLYRPPPDAKTLAVWRASVRDVAAYRDRYAITGTDPLGPDPDRDAGVQERAHRVAAAALSRITPPPTSGPSTADDSALDALHRRRGLARTQAARALEAARRTHEQTTRTRPTERPIYPQDPHPSGPEIGV